MNYDTFIDTVAERAGISPDEAVVQTRSTLQTLSDRLTSGDVLDLSARLAKPLQAALRPRRETAERFGLDEFVRRVGERAGVDQPRARSAIGAVFATLCDAIASGEFDDIMSQLPPDFTGVVRPVLARSGGARGR